MLSGHRIASIEVAQIHTRYPRTVGRNSRLGSHGTGFPSEAVVLRTDQGAAGWGVAAGDLAAAPQLVGQDLAELFEPEVGTISPEAQVLDFALHDLAGQIMQSPLHAILGSRGKESVTCYSGAIYFDDLDPEHQPRGMAAILQNCADDWAAGYRAFKVKIGRGHRWMDARAGFRRDIDVTRTVRETYPHARILVDVNDGYSPTEAVRFLKAVADCEIYWIEEPFPEDTESLQVLREYLEESGSSTLVADGETNPDERRVLELAEAGLIDVLLMDVVTFGLTAWRRLMPALRERGIAASPHAWGMPLKSLYAAQMSAGLGNVLTVEGVPGTTEGVDAKDYTFSEGLLSVPHAPGAGIELIAATQVLRHYLVASQISRVPG